ncbi:hypothetical protein ASG67_10470 [Sphingomonas sp. Leaf339]|nr:hypothetical protein ASG67_10470 [Sphingomonas sp. Leaf339]
MAISVNGAIVLSEQIGSRGIVSNFNYPIPTGGLQGACTIQMTLTATGGNGQDDPHTVNRPTLIVQEFKK